MAGIFESTSKQSSITNMHVTSVVMSRFSRVTVESKMKNELDKAQELKFTIRLPDAAFITELIMIVGGVTVAGKVQKKEVAKDLYENTVRTGRSAGLITADVRETQTFNVAANVPARENVSFKLVYQQLLQRKLGKYNHVILVNPGEVIDDFIVTVYIMERAGIESLSAHGPLKTSMSDSSSDAELKIDSNVEKGEFQAKVVFKPTSDQQRDMLLMTEEKERKLTVSYDVSRRAFGGEIQIRKGHFVHFFAPENLPVLPKNVVFVIDRSGSMHGRKMEQTKIAFVSVLKGLKEIDRFNIIVFDDRADVWKQEMMVNATNKNIGEAIRHVRSVEVNGSTDMNKALMEGAELLKGVGRNDLSASMIIILTDGNPNQGVSNLETILGNVKKAAGGRFSLFCLGFGEDVNHNFLNRLASENEGISRRIYDDSDADLQLKGFLSEVATPLLRHVKMSYHGAPVSDVSTSEFSQFFSGSESVVVGKIKEEGEVLLSSKIESLSLDGDIVHEISGNKVDLSTQKWLDEIGDFDNFIERIWAYFTIRDLLQKISISDTKSEIEQLNEQVTNIALIYSFVTPLTSMIVTVPDHVTKTPANELVKILPPVSDAVFADDEYDIGMQMADLRGMQLQCKSAGPKKKSLGRSFLNFLKPSFHKSRSPPPDMRQWTSSHNALLLDSSPASIQPDTLVTLTTSQGTISSPSNISNKSETREWKISLQEESWIDLLLETLCTIENEIIITCKGEVLLHHFGGTTPTSHILVRDREIMIKMIIFADDKSKPGIVISYTEIVKVEKKDYLKKMHEKQHITAEEFKDGEKALKN